MRVHYDEGLANHIGREPCAGIREGVGEASVAQAALGGRERYQRKGPLKGYRNGQGRLHRHDVRRERRGSRALPILR